MCVRSDRGSVCPFIHKSDISENLLTCSKQRGTWSTETSDGLVADALQVPLQSNKFDAVLCIAVMHHLSTKERRLQCLSELFRICKIGGLIDIQVWALEQYKEDKLILLFLSETTPIRYTQNVYRSR